MSIEERNGWILEHINTIEKTLKNYCERFPELDYEELYSDTMVYLIDYLDRKGMPSYGLSSFIGNYVHKLLNSKTCYETPVDFFELIFLQDFDFESSAIVKALIEKAAFDDELYFVNIVRDIAVYGYTYKETSKKYGLRNSKQTRDDYHYALMKLRMAAISLKYHLY